MMKWLFPSKKVRVLKYTEYKSAQALWLQVKDSERTYKGTNTEQFCVRCYVQYLKLIGFKNQEVFSKINEYDDNIGTYHLSTGDDFWNKGYNDEIAKNINELMDELV